MGVEIPLGFGQWTFPFRLINDPEEMVITMGFQDDPARTPVQLANVISDGFLAGNNLQAASGGNQWSCGPGRIVVNRTFGTFEGVGTTTRTFTNALTTLPQNCATLITKRTNRGGRRGRGRMYIPPFFPAESAVDPRGIITQTVVDSWNTELTTWLVAMTANSVPLFLLHSDTPEGFPVPPDAITQLVCSTLIATQRGRLRR